MNRPVSHPTARTNVGCRNCGSPAPLKFCPECGQETTLHPPTLREFLHEFAGHYVALEGTLWRTLWLLLRRPGRLTREYLDGRRRRYVLPLRLYLTASFVFFLVLKLAAAALHPETDVKVDGRKLPIAVYRAEVAPVASAAASAAAPAKFEPMHVSDCGGAGQRACTRVESSLDESLQRLQQHPQQALAHMRDHALHWAPYAIFVLLPAFAGIMQLAYRRRAMTYGEHFVFSLHLHAFWFLAGLALLVLPESAADVLQLGVMVYGVWAMHETYGGRWWTTALRALFVSVLYGVVLTAAITLLAFALLTAG